jgi:hypothetical protein
VFLAWPFVVPTTPLDIPPGSFFWYYLWTPSFYLELVIWMAGGYVLVRERRRLRRSVVGAE